MRVPAFLSELDIAFETIVHAPAFGAQRLAKVLHCPGRRVAKSVLLVGPKGKLLVLLPATHQIDAAALEKALCGPVRLADRWEIAEVFSDCEWGAVSPFGRLYGLSTLMDPALDANDWIVFESHTHAHAIRMRCRDFETAEQPQRLRLAAPLPN
jgi:Ala-tRNA(Pro) deacylase